MNHEKNFSYFHLYHILFRERPLDGELHPRMDEYYSARGMHNAVKRFRKEYPYEKYQIYEVARVYSFKDLTGEETSKKV